jgi:uncharacterized membrane protein
MEGKAKLFGHPVHQMLIVFPLGLLATAVIFDLIGIAIDHPAIAEVAYWMIAAGLVGGVVAAPFGTIDWLAIPRGTRAKSVGLLHGVGNVVVLALFLASWLLRRDAPQAPGALAHAAAYAGAAVAAVTAWLGGELVARLGVGVYDDAGLDASNSLRLRRRAASRRQRAAAHH